MSKLKHQLDLLCSIVPSTSQQSSGTLCFKLNREPLYSQYPPTKLLLHSLTQLKPHSNTRILQAYWKSISMHYSVHFFIFFPPDWHLKKGLFSLPINSSAFTICATYSQWGGCHRKSADEDVVSSLQYWPAVHLFRIIIGCSAFLYLWLKGA